MEAAQSVAADVASSLYHSGPGWFNDILAVSVYFDADLETYSAIPHTYKTYDGESRVEHYRPLFSSGAPVRGFVRITAPLGRTVAYNGVTVRLESGFFTLDDFNTKELFEADVEAAPAGSVTGTVDVPFVFPGVALYESYEGDLFSIRHSLSAKVARPWYTFEVAATAPFAVQRVHSLPRPAAYDAAKRAAGSKAAAAAAAESLAAAAGGTGLDAGAAEVAAVTAAATAASTTAVELDAQLALYAQQELTIEDVDATGSVTFSYDKGWCVGWGRGVGMKGRAWKKKQ